MQPAGQRRGSGLNLVAAACVLQFSLLVSSNVEAAPMSGLSKRIDAIMSRPQFRHARFGMEFYSLDSRKMIYALNKDQFFVPGSTGKLYPAAAALDLLGQDYRFRTKVYRTGPIADGVLKGDLVLVASGDLNLSNRIRPDGTLAFTDMDHSYDMVAGAAVVDGDPLAVMRKLASQIAALGIKRIEGRVLVDTSLFRQGSWGFGAVSNVPISPIVVNDNIVDVTVAPASAPGEPATLTVSPSTAYVRFVNRVNTSTKGPTTVRWGSDSVDGDGKRTVVVEGEVKLGGPSALRAYRVPDPRRFAEATLAKALNDAGVEVTLDLKAEPDFAVLASSYSPANQVAEHVSPPLSEAVKVTLKVSQNLHAATIPYLIGALVGKASRTPNETGFALQGKFLEKAGLDLTAAVQGDGAGVGARFTPEFTVRFLEHVWSQPYFPAFLQAQPIMGRDGSLADVQPDSMAAGHVYAKTGTDADVNLLSQGFFVNGKGLAGYIETPDHRFVAFALYVNSVPVKDLAGAIEVGDSLGEIVSAVYESLLESPATAKHRDRRKLARRPGVSL